MTNCATHTATTATAYCRTCGKPLCEECKRDVRGVIYCEECIAARLQGAPPVNPGVAAAAPARGLPNPTAAAFLGLIPGVGAFYNGQFQKGVIHFVILIGLGMLADQWEVFGAMIPFFIGYMVWDAYKTAKARVTGEPIPDIFGINDLFGFEPAKAKTGVSVAVANRPPIGAIVLIGLGVLFLLGDISRQFVRVYWPVVLIAIGLWKGVERWNVSE